MNFSNREDAVIADKMVQALADKGIASKTSVNIAETEFVTMLGIDLQNVRSILEIADRNQYLNGFTAFIRTLSAIDTGQDTYGFLRNGGFTAMWDKEYKEQKAKEKVDTVNTSVLKTNETVRLASIVTASATFITMVIAIIALLKVNTVHVKELPPLPQFPKQVQVSHTGLDTVFLLNPAPSQSQPTNPANTSTTHK